MALVLIPLSQVSETSHLFHGAVEVEVCHECGTVHAARFFCPTCSHHPRED